jgi:hypothetical protein
MIGEKSGKTARSCVGTQESFIKTGPSCAMICGEALPLRRSPRIGLKLDKISGRFLAIGANSAATSESWGVIVIGPVGIDILTIDTAIRTVVPGGGIAGSADSLRPELKTNSFLSSLSSLLCEAGLRPVSFLL